MAPATRKIALRHRVSVSPSERPLRLIPATAPWSLESGEYTRRQGQGRSWARPLQYRCLILLSRRNHTSTSKALEIDFCRATEVHLPDQIVTNKLHYDGMRARRPAQCPVLTAQHRAVRFNFARQHQNWRIRRGRPIPFTDESSFTESTND